MREQTPTPTQPRQPSPPPQQPQKRHAVAMVRSGTSRGSTRGTGGGKRYKYDPSLTPLPQRPYDMTEEQNTAIVQAQVDAHFGPKPAPPSKEKVPQKRAPAPKPVDSDYERQIRKAHRARVQKEARSSSCQQAAGKKCGKTVPQLGEQVAQSTPPLFVPTTHERSTRAQHYCGQTVNVPQLGDVVITEEHIMQAEMLKISVGQLLKIIPCLRLERRK